MMVVIDNALHLAATKLTHVKPPFKLKHEENKQIYTFLKHIFCNLVLLKSDIHL